MGMGKLTQKATLEREGKGSPNHTFNNFNIQSKVKIKVPIKHTEKNSLRARRKTEVNLAQWNLSQDSTSKRHYTSTKVIQWGKDSLQLDVLGQLDIYMQKNDAGPYLTPYTNLTQNGSKTSTQELNCETQRKPRHKPSSPQIRQWFLRYGTKGISHRRINWISQN